MSVVSGVPRSTAWQALHQGAVVADLPQVTGLRVTGTDRHDFVNGQLSHRVRDLRAGEVQASLLLDHKGHAHAEVVVHCRPSDLYLAVEEGAAGLVERHLREHVVFDQVELEPLAGTISTVTVQGPASADVLAALAPAPAEAGRFQLASFEGAEILVAPRRRSVPGGADVHVLTRQLDALLARFREAGLEPVDAELLEASRIAAGVPRAAREAGAGVLPQEAGLEGLVDYRKGCYLGQEIMARLEARGRLRRHLAGLRLEGDPGAVEPASRTEVRLDGRSVGRLGGAARHPDLGWIALAVLRDDVPADAELEVGETTGRRSHLPFAT